VCVESQLTCSWGGEVPAGLELCDEECSSSGRSRGKPEVGGMMTDSAGSWAVDCSEVLAPEAS